MTSTAFDHDSLATTYKPLACMPCARSGLTVDQCADLHSAELRARMAYANDAIASAPTAAAAVSPALAKAHAAILLQQVTTLSRRRSTRIAILDEFGIPLAVVDRTSREARKVLNDPRFVEAQHPGVYQMVKS